AEALSMFRHPSCEKRGDSATPPYVHIHQLRPTTNSEKLSEQQYRPWATDRLYALRSGVPLVRVDHKGYGHKTVTRRLVLDLGHGAAQGYLMGMGVPQLHQRPPITAVPVATGDWRPRDLCPIEERQLVRQAIVVTGTTLTISAHHGEPPTRSEGDMDESEQGAAREHRVAERVVNIDRARRVLIPVDHDQRGPLDPQLLVWLHRGLVVLGRS